MNKQKKKSQTKEEDTNRCREIHLYSQKSLKNTKSETIIHMWKACTVLKKCPDQELWDREPPKMSLSSICVGHLVWAWG